LAGVRFRFGVGSGENLNEHVENARLFSLPPELPPIYVSAFGPHSTSLAARYGDGYVNAALDRSAVGRADDRGDNR
jgi:alkanesulfonate monooxygenase SsuD/methylene tetrahydromethanopterin reductase-like flavin-dependent oxidoreductase (luciferase family)